MERINFDKSVQMHRACSDDDLRPALSYIYFKDGYSYATDAHILVKNSIDEICNINDEQKQFLNGKLLHKNHYKDILQYDLINVSDEGIECRNIKDKRKSFFYFCADDIKFPNAETIIQSTLNLSPVSIPEIGLNNNLIKNLNSALFDSNNCKYQFKGVDKGVVLQSLSSKSIGIIMPRLIN